jgi:uncharacterized membrane protein
MKNTVTTFLQSLFHGIWSIFLSGLFTILPITLTIALFNISFRLLKSWVQPVNRLHLPFVETIPHADIILVILLIFFVGAILHFFIIKSLVHALETIVFRLPLVSSVYSGIKQLVFAFDPNNKVSFKKVVLVEFPRTGMYSVGFLTGEFAESLKPDAEKDTELYTVFVPTTPNPTTGFFVILPAKDITVIDLTQQEAMTLIISGGIIQPKRFVKK